MNEKTYYDILEISPAASEEVIRAAYRSLAKKYHPDTCSGDKSFAEEKMKELNGVYAVLSDATCRAEYDKKLRAQSHPTPQASQNQSPPSPEKEKNAEAPYPDSAPHEESGCLGCLWSIAKAAIFIMVICWVISGMRSSKNDLPDTSSGSSSEVSTAESAVVPSQTPEVTSLSENARSTELLYFHKVYTDMGYVKIHQFPERVKVLEQLAAVLSSKDLVGNGLNLGYKNKLFGTDYYFITASQTDYIYVGDVKDGRPDGFGTILSLSRGEGTYELQGEVLIHYVGNFSEGARDGFGVSFFADDVDITSAINSVVSTGLLSEDEGELLVMYLFNHVSYEGYYKNNERNGKGNSFDFFIYEGRLEFPTVLYEPLEGYRWANAYPDVTMGEYKNDKLSGDVLIYERNHPVYEGEMKNGDYSGFGTLYYLGTTQVSYTGELKKGVSNGRGTYYDVDGTVIYDGEWENGDYAH